MRKLALALCASLAFASAAQAQSVKDFLAQVTKRWTAPAEPFRVIGNIHYVGTEGIAVYLVTSPQGHILIDTAMPQSTALIKDSIAKAGFKVADIKYILNTQAHFDHTGGFAEIKKDSGAQLVSGAGDKPLLEGGYYPGEEKNADLAFPAAKVDRTVGEGDKITVGDVTITAHATPGHSPGCTSYSMTVKDGGQDRSVLFFCSASVALNRLVGNPTHPGIVDDYRKTFARSRELKPDIFLGPHPEMFGMEQKRAAMKDGAANPFIKPGEFATFMAVQEKAFDAALAKQTAALKN